MNENPLPRSMSPIAGDFWYDIAIALDRLAHEAEKARGATELPEPDGAGSPVPGEGAAFPGGCLPALRATRARG